MNQIRVASYNIRKCVGLDRRRKPGRIVDVVNDLNADVVALQEADRRFGDRPAALPADMIEANTDFQVVHIPDTGDSVGWHGNAVLVRKDIGVTSVKPLDLPGTEPRGAVAVSLDNGLTLAAVHLGLLRSDRRRQLHHLAGQLKNSASTIILGDFNEWTAQRGLEPLHNDFTVHSPGRSFHAARPVAGLDRIALGHDLAMQDAGVAETRLSRLASDHLPVWADVALT